MDAFLDEFKSRNQIYHSSDDTSIKQQLTDSFNDIVSLIGEFDPGKFTPGKELVFERTRYVRNESLEYFHDNYQTMIIDASIVLAGEANAD